MNIVYDLLGFQSREHGERGIARFVLQLALALERTSPGLVTQYLMHPELPFPSGAEPLVASGRVVRADRSREVLAPSAGGVFIAGSPFEDFHLSSELAFPPWSRTPSWRTAAILHDLIPGKLPELYLNSAVDRHNYQARLDAVGRADWLLANSEASARDVVEMIGYDRRRVTVIGAGADDRFHRSPVPPAEIATELVKEGRIPGLRPGYLFFPTGMDPRKNIERTVEAYGRLPWELRRRHQLVVTCRLGEHGRRHLDDLAYAVGVTADLLATGYVSDDILCRLYQGAHLVIFPSLYEGFGLPALEAMKCGAPVIVADSSSLREVQTLAEARFDPMSIDSITAAMRRALDDDELLCSLRNQELPPFTWDNAAKLAAGAIEDLLARTRSRTVTAQTARPRLALVGPLPPQPCASANYVYRLAEELRDRCDLTLVVGVEPEGVEVPPGVAVEPIRRLDLIARSGGAFDRILYVLGNTACHVDVLEALRAHPGWVLLHDVQLTELYRQIHRLAPELLVRRSVGATLAELYPDRYRPTIEKMAIIPQHVADRFGILLARDAVERAERVLVHSSYEASLLCLDTGVEATAVYPHPCPPVTAAERDPAARPVISSFGPVPSSLQSETLLQALALVRRQLPAARLRFVGPIEGRQRAVLGELARQVGVAGWVDVIEPAAGAGCSTARLETAVAVQLQGPGAESGAAVAELLAAGVPTVVADIGPMSELPGDVAIKFDATGTAAQLAQLITGVLTDDEGRDALSQAARGHARAHSFAHAAHVLAGVLFA